MRYFESLIAETNAYVLRIVEDIPEAGLVLLAKKKHDFEYIPPVFGDTIHSCKKKAVEKYNAPMDSWRSEGKYFESLVATNDKGDMFRIKEDLPEVGFYLHAFDKSRKPIDEDLKGYSDLQDTIQACKEVALKVFGIPLDAWREEAK